MPKQYFHIIDGSKFGPFTGQQIRQRAASGDIQRHHHIQEGGLPSLYEARLVPGLFDTQAAPAVAGSTSRMTAAASRDGDGPSDPSPTHPQPAAMRPTFRNPVSTLLNSLTTLVLDSLHTRVKTGELSQQNFEQSATAMLMELQAAIRFAESQPELARVAGAGNGSESDRTGSGSRQTAATGGPQGSQRNASDHPHAPSPGKPPARPRPERMPMAPPAPAAGSTGASAWQMGAAALAGGAWGYLLARQGGMGPGMAYGPGAGDTHIHYHGSAAELADSPDFNAESADHMPVSYSPPQEDPQASVMGVDSNNDGLVDTFYGDSDGDGIADVMARDTDADGEIEQIAIDSDHDGSFDQTFTEDEISMDDDGSMNAEADDLVDADYASEEVGDGYDAGDHGGVADAGEDFGGDFDLG